MPLAHVSLTVSDRERSVAFYERHFGLSERVHDDEHRLILGDGEGSLLALIEGEPPDLPPDNHFGFGLGSAEEVRAARERLRADGVPEVEWQDDGAWVRVQVLDPDGYRVDLYS